MAIVLERMRKRRKELGIPYVDLAARSGVSVATVKRIFSGQLGRATLAHVDAVAEAMGLSLSVREVCPAEEFKERAAREKAARLVRMVQGTSTLEAQAVSKKHAKRLARESVHRLMAGSPRRVWAP
jgi:transcriptional regulator with XRE-family HTH domain